MHKKIFLFFILTILCANYAHADTNTQTVNIPPLIENIHTAKLQLEDVHLNYELDPIYKTVTKGKGKNKTSSKVLSSYNLSAKDLALAILDPATGSIEVTKAMQKGKTFIFPDPNFNISQNGFNGVSTSFTVSNPPNGIVMALKYLITGPETGSKQSILNSLSEAIYVPYSGALNKPDIATYGGQYLDSVLQQAVIQLSNIRSISQPGESVTQAIQPSIIKALIYAEHMDTAQFVYNSDTQSLINKLNTLFAANEGDTFKYSVSGASARGIAQFIPSTYASLVSRHPEAGLISDFVTAMSDHINSIKAEYLLIDDYIAAVHAKIPDSFNPAYVFDYGAASYNGGVTRVVNAIRTYGNNWGGDHSVNIAAAQTQIDAENSLIASLNAQYKKAKTKTDKATFKSQLAAEKAKLAALKDQLSSMQSDSLKNETVLYLDKMHKLVQIFNSQSI